MILFKKFKLLVLKFSTAFIVLGLISPPGCAHFDGAFPSLPSQYLITITDKHNIPIDSVELIIRNDDVAHQKYSYNKTESDDPILSDSLGKMIFYRSAAFNHTAGTGIDIFGRLFFVRYFINDPNNYKCYFYKSGKLIYKQKLLNLSKSKVSYRFDEINLDTMKIAEDFIEVAKFFGFKGFNVFENKIVVKKKVH
jgi:hypothetical protein